MLTKKEEEIRDFLDRHFENWGEAWTLPSGEYLGDFEVVKSDILDGLFRVYLEGRGGEESNKKEKCKKVFAKVFEEFFYEKMQPVCLEAYTEAFLEEVERLKEEYAESETLTFKGGFYDTFAPMSKITLKALTEKVFSD